VLLFKRRKQQKSLKMRVLSIVTLLGLASMAAANPDWVAQQRSAKNSILTFSVSLPESNLDKLDQIFQEVTDPDR
jgi:hypothetical protein